jgi:hypothetical protein
MRNDPFFRLLSLYLIVAVIALSFPSQSWAMLVTVRDDATRAGDIAKVQAALESTAVKQRLLDYGLTAEEASQRLALLSDEQIHRFATEIDSVQAGGDGGDVIFVLLVILIVLVILELTGHHVVMKR